MGKIKYTDQIKDKVIELRLTGKSSTEITAETGMGKESQNKLFKKMGIKMTEGQAATARARRWLNHEPIIDGKKICSGCHLSLPVEEFYENESRLSGLTSCCKKCYSLMYKENSEVVKERVRKYRESNPEKYKTLNRNNYIKNKEAYVDKAAQWTKNNPEKRKQIQHDYDKRTQPRKNARTAKYRATKIQATPPWISQHQLDEIKRMYENCPPGFQVDHIIPLRGKDVRGLHVPWNLQYLPALENNKKGNRLP